MCRKCIQGLLSDRIVLLTTHATKYYSVADRIVLLEGGTIATQGNLETLKTTLPLTESVHDEPGIKDNEMVGNVELWGDTGKSIEGVNLEEEEEERKRGIVPLKVYLEYFLYGASPFILLLVPVVYFSGGG